MSAQVQNIAIDQGSEFILRGKVSYQVPDGCVGDACSIVPIDLTNKQVRAQLRSTYDAVDSVDFVCTITDAVNGAFELYLSAVTTATMTGTSYVWDCEVYDPTDENVTFRAFQGTATVSPEVTK